MRYTHEIYSTTLLEAIDLDNLKLEHCERKMKPFNCLHWREFGGLCQIFNKGKITFHGCKDVFFKYLVKLGMSYGPIRLITKSACHDLGRTVDYYKLAHNIPGASYEPELFHPVCIRREKLHFIVFHSGKVLITGIKTDEDELVCESVILELELIT